MSDLVEKTMALINQYWDLAHAEGKEGRDHDTINGDAQRVQSDIHQVLQEAQSRIAELETELNETPRYDSNWGGLPYETAIRFFSTPSTDGKAGKG